VVSERRQQTTRGATDAQIIVNDGDNFRRWRHEWVLGNVAARPEARRGGKPEWCLEPRFLLGGFYTSELVFTSCYFVPKYCRCRPAAIR